MIKKQNLGGTWLWKRADEDAVREGNVPGSVLSDMLHSGLLEDPFWRTNEYTARELMAQDYVYKRSFIVPAEDLLADSVVLVCEGLDTFAAVRVNGALVAETSNMHRTHRLQLKDVLHVGENEIEIYLSSALSFARKAHEASDIHYTSTGSIHGNGAIRKAHYMFGWDWGPQLPDMGIFRDIYIEFCSLARFEDVRIRQFHNAENGFVDIEIETDSMNFSASPLTVSAEIHSPTHEILIAMQSADGKSTLKLTIEKPVLWWPHGLGGQPLYEIHVFLHSAAAVEDSYNCRVGLRTITVSTQKDEWGSEFAFVVNGYKMFAMGANYIPQDNLITRIATQDYRKLVKESAEANMNTLRVWGGGYYPDDAFYDACDEFGVLVWQDMMFACNVYALTDGFEKNIVAETQDNVRRLRHHASLALWCSNNEMEWGWGEGWQRILGHHPRYKADYLKIFEMILPRALAQCDDQTYFWPSSPSSGGAYDYPNDPDRGDQHYWEVWHSGKPFTEYREKHFRFCSEYGFQSFPHMKTIKSFSLPQDWNIFSEVMESHQKNGQANSKIFTYISDYFLYPKDLDSIAYISQILQLKAIQYGVEHWRQNRGRCMGSLYWQLNDCWPVASWASIDYYGRWKALHYAAKRFYAPFCVSAREKIELSTDITYYVHNDTREPKCYRLEASLLDTQFAILHKQEVLGVAAPLSATVVLQMAYAGYIVSAEHKKTVFARYRLYDETNECVGESITMFVKPKYFQYPKVEYGCEIRDSGDFYEISLTSNGFSNYTELYFSDVDVVLSDNFFDITGAPGRVVSVEKSRMLVDPGLEKLREQVRIRSVVDTYTIEGQQYD